MQLSWFVLQNVYTMQFTCNLPQKGKKGNFDLSFTRLLDRERGVCDQNLFYKSFYKFHTISKTVRNVSVGQPSQKRQALHPIFGQNLNM